MTSPSHLVRACRAPETMAAYVGEDWMFFVDESCCYCRSEAIAPLLLMAEPGHELRILYDQSDVVLVGQAIAHSAGAASAALQTAGGSLCLYIDPLSPTGRALAGLAGSNKKASAWGLPPDVLWSKDWFSRLLHGTASGDEVTAWITSLQQALLHEATTPDDGVNDRLLAVAQALGEHLGGRLDCPRLAARAHWSAGYLRRAFRKVSGVSMSRYQVWRRLLLTIRLRGVERGDDARSGGVTATLHEAGFYDAPHGFRTIRQYLGIEPSDALTRARYCPRQA